VARRWAGVDRFEERPLSCARQLPGPSGGLRPASRPQV